MAVDGKGAKLPHVPQNRNATAFDRKRSKVRQRSLHRIGVCVVGVVHDRPAARRAQNLLPSAFRLRLSKRGGYFFNAHAERHADSCRCAGVMDIMQAEHRQSARAACAACMEHKARTTFTVKLHVRCEHRRIGRRRSRAVIE